MKQLPIDWFDLELAFEVRPDDYSSEYYFDLESGKVVYVDEEIASAADRVMEELDEGSDFTDDSIRDTRAFQDLPDHEKPSVLAAITIDCGDLDQFAKIPYFDSHTSYQFMKDFIAEVRDDGKRKQLSNAIAERKPFRNFRDVLATDRRLERQWHEFETTCQHEAMLEWLRSIGVEPANPKAAATLPPLPDLRKIMFAEVRRFVRLARDIQGVSRIALIGSLASEKEFPKDIDMLVTVSDDCDLTPLARLARQLSGHMNSHSAGADVFLSSEEGRYLGRTCPWKNCGPGYRVSCDAMHCGARLYLHDDFSAACLKEELIAQPPVLLWPDPATNQNVPLDVHQELIEELAKDPDR